MYVIEAPPIVEAVPTVWQAPRWRVGTRVAFRFCVVYFGLYVGMTQMLSSLLPLPVGDIPQIGDIPPMKTVVSWVATTVFGVSSPLVITGSGSGDKTYDWVLAFCVLVMAVAGTALWSVLDRRRRSYAGVQKWFRLFARFGLGSTMISYGMVKAIPLQMPAPPLTRLLEPFGNFSPMSVLWYSIGASRPYEIVTGCAELTAGILLLIPRTATLGALTALAVTIQIFTLNMTYDVPVKLFSFHLILLSLFLLAPDVRRLANVFLFNRTAERSTLAPRSRTVRWQRIAVAAQLVFAAYLLGMNLYGATQSWKTFGGGAPKSPLYGVWNVEHMTIDGVERAALVTDYDRWRRVIFDRPTAISFQRMDDTFAGFGARIDMDGKAITLTGGNPQSQRGKFTFDRQAPDRLVLAGDVAGKKIHMRLALFDRNRFLLVSRGFNWIQEYPFQR